MDDKNNNNNINISIFNSKSSSNSNQISSLVLDHLLCSSSPLSSALTAAATSVGSSHVGNVADLTTRSVSIPPSPLADVPVGFDPAILVHGSSSRKTPEADIDSYDCESEEDVDVVEEPVKPSGHRSSSGSKRSRAAEVHNLSEKRRRSRINEKMKALQSLIPNSNKTDKASMLDEAIEYLKQLQLQVQMLSMRNGLSLSPTFLPGDLPAHQASEMCFGFGVDNGPLMNLEASTRPVSQDSLIQDSLRLPNQCTSSLRSHTPRVSDIKDPMLTFTMESSLPQESHVQHGSFNLSAIAGNECMTPHPQVGAFNMTRPEEPQMK